MFGPRKRIRRVAAQVLLVWLFAFGAGIVNACLLEPVSLQASASVAHAPVSHDEHGQNGQRHQSPQDVKSPCIKFCDEATVGAQPVKQQVDPFTAVWLGPLPSGSIVVGHTPTAVGSRAIDSIRWRVAISVPIAFLRLTL